MKTKCLLEARVAIHVKAAIATNSIKSKDESIAIWIHLQENADALRSKFGVFGEEIH